MALSAVIILTVVLIGGIIMEKLEPLGGIYGTGIYLSIEVCVCTNDRLLTACVKAFTLHSMCE